MAAITAALSDPAAPEEDRGKSANDMRFYWR